MTRGPDKQFSPDVALDKAMQLFLAKGYAATSLSDLLETMEIGRKSLYDTFGNKRALHFRALQRYSDTVVGRLSRRLNDTNHSALDNVRATMRALEAEHSEPMSMGCLFGVGMAQFLTDDEETAALLRKHMRRIEQAYYKAFARAQAEGDLKAGTNVRNLARLFMSAHQGLALIGRVSETNDVQRGIVDGALAAFEAA